MHLQSLRKRLRIARQTIPERYATQASYRFSELISQLDCYQSAFNLGAFLPFNGEADPLPLMDRAILDGKSVHVPIVTGKTEPLSFVRWTRESELRANQFGIQEPVHQESDRIDGRQLDCVIVPLVGFDESCHRIGVGGGFYDRTFACLPAKSIRTYRLVGIAFELQKVPEIKAQPHDVPLDFVVTESTVYDRGSEIS
ncbi:MAG: 5-formyltetrahydrofolate cyclo-ligase [Planctomycetota bacterium]